MKTPLIVLLPLLAAGPLAAEPPPGFETYQILFQGGSQTRVINALNGRPIGGPIGDSVSCGLYYAPDGVTNLAEFSYAPPPAERVMTGHFFGGVRDLYLPADTTHIMVQVRSWEASYGDSYEAAAVAPPINGKTALLGVSQILRVAFTEVIPELRSLPGWTVTAEYVSSLYIDNQVVAESTNGTTTARFNVSLLYGPTNDVVTVQYATVDGTALAGQDYVATNGVLVFNPGETDKTIEVTVTADLPPEPEEDFFVELSHPVNAVQGYWVGTCIITEVQVLNVEVSTAVSINTITGDYLVERSIDLVNWEPVPGINPVSSIGGQILTVIDKGSGCQDYYRAHLLP